MEHFFERRLRTPTLNEAYFERIDLISKDI
jgi:hypothetical protein